MGQSNDALRRLPRVDELASLLSSETDLPHLLVVDLTRHAIDAARAMVRDGEAADAVELGRDLVRAVERSRQTPVINATGVLLHTNLGRAPWPEWAAVAAVETATNYTNLELSLEDGERGGRHDHVRRLLRLLTGAEDAHVVNNNAAAVYLVLTALARSRAVPVSRGELIEIGGSYRLPELMRASGATLIEVGTTNRTRLGDYETALQLHDCALVLKVHPSNYHVVGFRGEVGVTELSALARAAQVPLVFDAGSGLLDEETPWLPGRPPDWLGHEPGVRQSLERGADLVTFSGDKLLGGPQAGLVVGQAELVSSLRAHPLARALRVDGATLAGVEATLETYAAGSAADIPLWKMATLGWEVLARRAGKVATAIGGEVRAGSSVVGAGSVPGASIPTPVIVLPGAGALYQCLLDGRPAVVSRREKGDLVIDLRTVPPEADGDVVEAVLRCR